MRLHCLLDYIDNNFGQFKYILQIQKLIDKLKVVRKFDKTEKV